MYVIIGRATSAIGSTVLEGWRLLLFPKVLAGYSGAMVDSVGYPVFFIGTAILGVPVLVLVRLAGRLLPTPVATAEDESVA